MKSLVWNFEHQTINIFRETSWQSSWKQLLNWGEMILVDSIDCGMHAAFDLDLHCITDLVNFLMFRVNCDKSLSCWTLKRIEATVYNATGRNLPCSFILNLCIFYFGKWTDDNDADKPGLARLCRSEEKTVLAKIVFARVVFSTWQKLFSPGRKTVF